MELWIRSTARTNLLKVRFLTIMKGEKFYGKDEWEFKGYTICNCTEQGNYELLGTYKTKERALEVLDEIYKLIEQGDIVSRPNQLYGSYHMPGVGYNKLEINGHNIFGNKGSIVYEMPNE